jgi:putative membrane protein
LVRPIILLFTLPLTILTLGLFAFVINALMLWLTAAIVPGFEITNFMSALIGSLLLTIMTSLLGMIEARSHGRLT